MIPRESKHRTTPPILPVMLLLPALLAHGCAVRNTSSQERQLAAMIQKASAQNEEKREKERPQANHLQLARELVAKGMYRVALVQLEQARDAEKGGCEVFHLMGRCHLGLSEYHKAVESFRKALERDAGYAPSHNGLGLAYDLSGSRELAWKAYGRAIELDPARADFHNNLGFSKLLSGRYPEAERHLRESLSLRPDLEAAANNLALCLAAQGRYEEASALLKARASAAAAANNLGVLHDVNGEREAAVECYRAALNLDETLRDARENLAQHGESLQKGKPDASEEKP